jgi:hypothetical protein
VTTEIQKPKCIQEIRVYHTVCEISIMLDSAAVVTKMHRNRITCIVQHLQEHVSNARIFSVYLETITNLTSRDTSRAEAPEVLHSAEMSDLF